MRKILCIFLAFTAIAHAQSYRFVVIVKTLQSPFWEAVHAGVTEAQTELKAEGTDIEIDWQGMENESKIDQQVGLYNEAVKSKPHGIILAPASANALAPGVAAGIEAGVPALIIDSNMKAVGQCSFIATDNYKGGVMAARRLSSILGGKGKVLLYRALKGAGATEARERGFLETIKSYPGIELIDGDIWAGGNRTDAETNAEMLLKKTGTDIQGVFAPNSTSSHGMLIALRKAELAGKVKFVGFDVSAETLAAINAGDMQASVVQNPRQMGYLSVKTLLAHVKGQPVEGIIQTDCRLIYADNLTQPEIAKLIDAIVKK